MLLVVTLCSPLLYSSSPLPSSLTPPSSLFFFNDPAPTEIYTLSLHDALPISWVSLPAITPSRSRAIPAADRCRRYRDRKSTRLNSSHLVISYAVFCLKKKKKKKTK